MSMPQTALEAIARPAIVTLAFAEAARNLLAATFIGGVSADVVSAATHAPSLGDPVLSLVGGVCATVAVIGAGYTLNKLNNMGALKTVGLPAGVALVGIEAARDFGAAAIAHSGFGVLPQLGPTMGPLVALGLSIGSAGVAALAAKRATENLRNLPAHTLG